MTTCCHSVALTGGSDVAPATLCVASSRAVITSAPKSGFVPHMRNGCATIMSCCDLTLDLATKTQCQIAFNIARNLT